MFMLFGKYHVRENGITRKSHCERVVCVNIPTDNAICKHCRVQLSCGYVYADYNVCGNICLKKDERVIARDNVITQLLCLLVGKAN